MGSSVQFANGLVNALPTGGVNIVVLQNFDDDANPQTPFGAGNAANLIASRVTTHGSGLLYLLQPISRSAPAGVLDGPEQQRLGLEDLTRILNPSGPEGRNAIPTFTAANFDITTSTSAAPEPSSFLMMTGVGLLGLGYTLRRRRVHAKSALSR